MSTDYSVVKEWFSSKTKRALSSFSLIGYYSLSIFIFGNVGVWIAFVHLYDPSILVRAELLLAFISTTYALFGSLFADIFFLCDENHIKGVFCFSIVALIVITVLALFKLLWMQILFSSILYIFISYLWFLVNADKIPEKLNPTGTGDIPSGKNNGVQTDE